MTVYEYDDGDDTSYVILEHIQQIFVGDKGFGEYVVCANLAHRETSVQLRSFGYSEWAYDNGPRDQAILESRRRSRAEADAWAADLAQRVGRV